ncbi:MAG TPA: prepilin-type N-terminal cleavage/methylation domain-containing protein [Dehalococcoidales bacterium]|nr:prepilin-type N-terminal cleavage/methylation domain-containing protein [Dehalococcoidales bacterium]
MKQKGFTLIEILVVMAVGGMIMTVAMLTIYQIVWGTERSNDQVIALTDAHYAAMWLMWDLQMAQNTNLTDGDSVPKSSASLSWIDNTGFVAANASAHSSNYTLSGTELLRNYDGTTKIVGRHISSVGFIQNGSVVTCNLTATGPGIMERVENLEFSVITHMRPEEVQ